MFFDPSRTDQDVEGGTVACWQPPRAAAARYRAADDFLSLPSVSEQVPPSATMKWKVSGEMSARILAHFRYGPLRAADVHEPSDELDAFAQAFFAWVNRQKGEFTRLTVRPMLLDATSVDTALEHVCLDRDFEATSPLYLGFCLPDENLFEMAPHVDALRSAHPLLLRTMLRAIDLASYRTVMIRSPQWFLGEFAAWFWGGDPEASDEDAKEALSERFGENDPDIAAYLPSTARPLLCPDEAMTVSSRSEKWRPCATLSPAQIRALRPRLRGRARKVCTELLTLNSLMRKSRTNDLLRGDPSIMPLFSAVSFVLSGGQTYVGQILDGTIESAYQGGDHCEFAAFSPLSMKAADIRRQYADWSLAFQIMTHLDRLLSLVTS
ncbi:PRTRC system protein F [Paraburkholderia tropica]|uniref:PRTRC system protein F n=1 Tax=Paraburkholderia tropica TaxID=92647 RepID=UPI00161E7554|nr:PRTRC system protein F [Paraburkholderia tropica]MBB6323232.1 PRTRC genetic system protein F [Paraburkholderia tropica]